MILDLQCFHRIHLNITGGWVAYGLFPFFQVHKKISRDNLKFIWHAQPLDWKTQEKIMK